MTTIRLEQALLDGLRRVKLDSGIPISEQVRRAILAWLTDRDPVRRAGRKGAR
jgi:hypothetical protein